MRNVLKLLAVCLFNLNISLFMLPIDPPNPTNQFYADHIQLLLDSYQRLLNKPLLLVAPDLTLAEQVFKGGFALLSHNTDNEPLFNYANVTALHLFELEWQELVGMPSRLSAEPMLQMQREQLLKEVADKGYIDHYSGVRIAKSGKRFLINNAVVWNVYDQQQHFYGQAAYFKDWVMMP
ncbi:MEKHLA domain-containing protein [Methylomonas sp. AM2-LC]|uniref:MEKHLA domain-containing protein n=1 Tax=Methylomonas sp. AM2-LC TaxID=3153301 RepID=UPI003267CF56